MFKHITKDGTLPLINYHIEEFNINSLCMIIPFLVPRQLSKVYLVNNFIPEQSLCQLLSALSKTSQLKGLGFIQNNTTYIVIQKLAEIIVE